MVSQKTFNKYGPFTKTPPLNDVLSVSELLKISENAIHFGVCKTEKREKRLNSFGKSQLVWHFCNIRGYEIFRKLWKSQNTPLDVVFL